MTRVDPWGSCDLCYHHYGQSGSSGSCLTDGERWAIRANVLAHESGMFGAGYTADMFAGMSWETYNSFLDLSTFYYWQSYYAWEDANAYNEYSRGFDSSLFFGFARSTAANAMKYAGKDIADNLNYENSLFIKAGIVNGTPAFTKTIMHTPKDSMDVMQNRDIAENLNKSAFQTIKDWTVNVSKKTADGAVDFWNGFSGGVTDFASAMVIGFYVLPGTGKGINP